MSEIRSRKIPPGNVTAKLEIVLNLAVPKDAEFFCELLRFLKQYGFSPLRADASEPAQEASPEAKRHLHSPAMASESAQTYICIWCRELWTEDMRGKECPKAPAEAKQSE